MNYADAIKLKKGVKLIAKKSGKVVITTEDNRGFAFKDAEGGYIVKFPPTESFTEVKKSTTVKKDKPAAKKKASSKKATTKKPVAKKKPAAKKPATKKATKKKK